jgi:hypothetical protein
MAGDIRKLGKTTSINMRFNIEVLGHIDAEAKRLGISRTAWLHVAASKMLQAETEHHTTGDQPGR